MSESLSEPIPTFLRPRARLLRTIGDELISSEIVALIELVKNAYDADASFVLINFQAPLEVGKGIIEVIDDGHGMTLETIQHSWMEPATSHKKNRRRSPKRRMMLGNKGIGRFAASRLADNLEIVTRSCSSQYEVKAKFDWSQFDDEDKYLDEVKVFLEEQDIDSIAQEKVFYISELLNLKELKFQNGHGTILKMRNLRNKWDKKRAEKLKTGLSRLVSPFSNISDFDIYLKFPDALESLSGKVESPDILGNPIYRVKGTVNIDGSCELSLESRKEHQSTRTISSSLLDHGELAECGGFYIDIMAWPGNSGLEDSKSIDKQVRRILKDIGGISIYRDGFRIFPYGERGDDWLNLDLRRVQNPTRRLSNNLIVGYILISSQDNPNLCDQSNREGLIENQAMEDLRRIVREVLTQLEAYFYELKPNIKNTSDDDRNLESISPKQNIFNKLSLSPVRDVVKDKYEDKQDEIPEIKEIISFLDTQEKEYEKSVSLIKETLSRYQRLATLGQIVDIVLHEGRTPLFKIGSEAKSGISQIEKYRKLIDNNELFDKLSMHFKFIKNQASLLSSIFKKIEPFSGRKRGRPKTLVLENVISETFSILKNEIQDLGIKIQLPITRTQVTVEKSEIQEILLNLLNNSVFWLRKVPRENRTIAVEVVKKTVSSLQIIFSDSGPGVAPEYRDKIFEPYFSLKSDGVGLGLTIAGEIVTEFYDGMLELIDDASSSGATFKIVLNKRV